MNAIDSQREAAITASSPIRLAQAQPVQPRAVGAALVRARGGSDGQTRLVDLRTSGALKLVFPRRRTGIEAVFVNTAGGVTGGDALSLTASVEDRGSLTLTTQAAERAYRAQPGQTGQVTTGLSVGDEASLFWLPQELIVFEGCALSRRIEIDLAPSARLIFVEPVVLGRTAMGEQLHNISLNDRIVVRRGGAPLFLDGVSLSGDAAREMTRQATGAGAGAYATLLVVDPNIQHSLGDVRAMLPDTAGASLVASDTLLLRLLATDGFALRTHLLPILDRLTGGTLPRSWRL